MASRVLLRNCAGAVALALLVSACSGQQPPPPPSADRAGILFVNLGEEVQSKPANEQVALALSSAIEFAETSNDVGYPWIDPATGGLVMSAASAAGRQAIDAAGFSIPYTIRDVKHGGAELRQIMDDVTFLHSRGVPKSELIYSTVPDHRDNRALIVLRAMDKSLLDYLARHYPADALAVKVDPAGAGGAPASGTIELPTYGPGDAYPAALATGTIELQGSCVVLHDTTDHLLIWPSGTAASLDEGALIITSPAGPTLREHQKVSVGGGEYSQADFPRAIAGIPDACQGYLLWLAAPAWS